MNPIKIQDCKQRLMGKEVDTLYFTVLSGILERLELTISRDYLRMDLRKGVGSSSAAARHLPLGLSLRPASSWSLLPHHLQLPHGIFFLIISSFLMESPS